VSERELRIRGGCPAKVFDRLHHAGGRPLIEMIKALQVVMVGGGVGRGAERVFGRRFLSERLRDPGREYREHLVHTGRLPAQLCGPHPGPVGRVAQLCGKLEHSVDLA